jgi:hypothetical protein
MASISLKYKSKSGNLTAPGDVDPGAMIPLATTVVGAGGVSSVSFTNISPIYQHLQLRMYCQFNDVSAGLGGASLRFNSDASTNYTRHELGGEGTAAFVVGQATGTATGATVGRFYFTPSSSIFSPAIVDILDYADTNKYTTVRSLGGTDVNGSGGELRFSSSLWINTAAISSITIPGDFKQYSHIALYGIKRAGA